MYTCIHVYMYLCIYVYMYTCIYVYTYVCMMCRIYNLQKALLATLCCMHVCMHIKKCIHIYTNIFRTASAMGEKGEVTVAVLGAAHVSGVADLLIKPPS